jgi:tetratricopeptide (TPR) repeat protein
VAAQYYLADAYNHLDRLTDALHAFETTVRLQPNYFRALKGLGNVLDRLGRNAEAAAAHRRAREAQGR